MSSDDRIAISVQGVGKRYKRGHTSSAGLLSERVNNALVSPLRRALGRPRPAEPSLDRADDHPAAKSAEEFWALRNLSFDIRFGEAVGIIGRNGAGKSTMLKLLSRITLPTEGRIELHGRTTSLLEVGTGFHPELTGRENIFLNGTLLGMRRQDILERYEEIVEFSGVRQFIDTPVKRYSSGMFVRLAFAVAAHLDPEILIIDEVLAVGDMEFQRRSLDRMQETASAGRTVVFVSHDMASIERLCDRVLVLDGGQIVYEGPAQDAVGDYVDLIHGGHGVEHRGLREVPADIERWGTGEARITMIALRDLDGQPLASVAYGQPFAISLVYEWAEPVQDVAFEVGISRPDGQRIVTVQSIDGSGGPVDVAAGRQEVTVTLADLHLLPGEFSIDAGCHRMNGNTIDIVNHLLGFRALNGPIGGDRYEWPGVRGYVRPDSVWQGHDVAASVGRESR